MQVTKILTTKKLILLTTSRKPTENIRTFCKDIAHTFSNVIRINRGKLSLEELVAKAREFNCEKMIIIERWKEGTAKVEFFEIKKDRLVGAPPIFFVREIMFRREFEEKIGSRKRIKTVAIETSPKKNFTEAIENVLANFFEIPIIPYKTAIDSKFDAIMRIEGNSANNISVTFKLVPKMVEVGPRIKVGHLIWELNK